MIRVCDDAEALSGAVAELVAARAAQAAAECGRFSVALSGGHTPERAFELLAGPPYRERIPWGQVHVFWGDERCVPPDDPRSNERMARQALLGHVPIPEAHIHPIRCAPDPDEAAERYEEALRAFFTGSLPAFDLVLLGLGEDGHTASLFPGSPALEEQERWAVAVAGPGGGPPRVTLTAPLLNRAATAAFVVSGANKAPVLREVLEEARDPRRLPAQIIHPTAGELLWLVDRDAAGDLTDALGKA